MKSVLVYLALPLIVLGAGCGSSKCKCVVGAAWDAEADIALDRPEDRTAAVDQLEGTDSGCAADARFECAHGNGHFCADTTEPARCVAGHWQCDVFSVPASQCRCFGPTGDGCSYTADCVRICSDGGAEKPIDVSLEAASPDAAVED